MIIMEKDNTPEDVLHRLYQRAASISKQKETNENLNRFWKLAQMFFTALYVNRVMEDKGETDVRHFVQTRNYFGIPSANNDERKQLLNRICSDVKHGRKVKHLQFNGVQYSTAFIC